MAAREQVSQKMKLLHLVDSLSQGGASRASVRIQDALGTRPEFDSIIGCFSRSNEEAGARDHIEMPLTYTFARNPKLNYLILSVRHYLREDWRECFDYFFSRNHDLENEIQRFGPQAIIVHWVRAKHLGLRSIGRLTPKIILVLHDLRPLLGRNAYPRKGWVGNHQSQFALGERVISWAIRKLLPRTTLLVAPSEWIREAAVKLGWGPDQVVQILYPLDTDFWRRNSEMTLPKDDDPIRVGFGFFGNSAAKRKGQDLVHNSLAMVSELLEKRGKTLKFSLFGDAIPPKMDYANIGFEIHGNLDDQSMRLLYSSIHYLLVPSRQENLGQVSLEAQSCGTPCIVMAATGLLSTVARESSLIIHEPTPQALAASLTMALDNLDRIETMSTSARLNATSRLRLEEIANQYVRLLTSK